MAWWSSSVFVTTATLGRQLEERPIELIGLDHRPISPPHAALSRPSASPRSRGRLAAALDQREGGHRGCRRLAVGAAHRDRLLHARARRAGRRDGAPGAGPRAPRPPGLSLWNRRTPLPPRRRSWRRHGPRSPLDTRRRSLRMEDSAWSQAVRSLARRHQRQPSPTAMIPWKCRLRPLDGPDVTGGNRTSQVRHAGVLGCRGYGTKESRHPPLGGSDKRQQLVGDQLAASGLGPARGPPSPSPPSAAGPPAALQPRGPAAGRRAPRPESPPPPGRLHP